MDKKIEKKGWPWWRIALLVLIVAAAAYLIPKLYDSAGRSRLNVQVDRLLTDTIHRGVFKEYIPLFGVVEPIKTVYIDAVEGGRVEEIFVEDGSMLKEGQPIMRLSNLDLQLQVLNQEAQIITQINAIRNTSILMEQQSLNFKEQALDVEYQIDLLTKRTNRNQQLFASNVISQVEYEETRDEYEHLLRRRKLMAAT
ncbi:MAG: biotin/lipoyl-binding protein, partial [Saprospiraceae bacterium]|nr:biotin/lipoyl-binding protein [Saprospiraceae bacterium]